jgi:putative transposase
VDGLRFLLRVVHHRRLFSANLGVAGVDEQDQRSGDRGAGSSTRDPAAADSEFTARGLVHQSDAGSQYTALAFTEELAEAGIAGSIRTIGDALDNALMESTIDLYKTECLTPAARGCNWTSLREVERETAEWVR